MHVSEIKKDRQTKMYNWSQKFAFPPNLLSGDVILFVCMYDHHLFVGKSKPHWTNDRLKPRYSSHGRREGI